MSTACLVVILLSGCSGGAGGSISSTGSDGPGASGVTSFAAGPDPSIPTFAGAPADQSFIATAMANAGVSLSAPSSNTVVYVEPPVSYTPTGVGQIGTGTKSNPYQNLIAVVNNAVPGESIYLEPGVYLMSSMATAFGEPQDALTPVNAGTAVNPIVVTTDPTALNWPNGTVASLDFQMQTSAPAGSRYAAIWPKDYWDFENLEIKDALDRTFWLAARHVLLYHNDIHHNLISGTQDNNGIIGIMILPGGGAYNDFIVGNNIHGLATYDSNGNPTAWSVNSTVNIGCTYSETYQYYNSNIYLPNFPTNGNSLTVAQLATYTAPPDSNVYYYGNVVHNCMRGIAAKEPIIGPWYLLSNVIYDVQAGIKLPVSGTVSTPTLVQNNIIYNAGPQQLADGIQLGIAAQWDFLGNADNMTVANNTVIGAATDATLHYGGFNDVIDHNVFVTTGSGVAHLILPGGYGNGGASPTGGVNTNGLTWYNNGAWPSAIGEYLFSVNTNNPYYTAMPTFLQEEGWNAMRFNNNLYTNTPIVVLNATPLVGPNLSGTDIDQQAQILPWNSLSVLFRNATTDDYRAGASPGVLATVGSQIP